MKQHIITALDRVFTGFHFSYEQFHHNGIIYWQFRQQELAQRARIDATKQPRNE
jgi:hypothetical protein